MMTDLADRVRFTWAWRVAHFCLGHARRGRSQIRRAWTGFDPAKASHFHAVYVHFDPQGTIHDYVMEQLRQLALANYRVTFVSNASRLDPAQVESIKPMCRQIILRRNVGYDFGAYKDGIASLGDLKNCERLLLMNDSVYGPLRPLTDVLRSADPAQSDIWGITDSWDRAYHIQTYFILFFSSALKSPAFQAFWHRLPYVNSKSWIIRNAETQLTRLLTQHKLRAAALCPYWDVATSVLDKLQVLSPEGLAPVHQRFLEDLKTHLVRGTPLNPSHFFWETLIDEFGCPFIKRELIRENPGEVVYAWRWPDVIGPHSAECVGMIRRHLQAS